MPLTRYDLALRLATGGAHPPTLHLRTWCIDRGEARRQALAAADALCQAGAEVDRITASSAETGEIVTDQATPPHIRRRTKRVAPARQKP